MRMKSILFVSLLVAVCLLSGCGDKTNGPNNIPVNGQLEVVYPKGGETLYIGNKVTVSFKINPAEVLAAVPWISVNGGQKYTEITTNQINAIGTDAQVLTYEWTIGSEATPANYKDTNTQCILKIQDYATTTKFHTSGQFSILKK